MANAPRQFNLTPDDDEATQTAPPPAAAPAQASATVGTHENPHKDQSNVTPMTAVQEFSRFEDLAKKHGNEDGKGKRAFVAWARTLVDGGTFTLKVGGKSTDAEKLYRAFSNSSRAASGGANKDAPMPVLGEENKLSESSQISKVKAFIRLGNHFKDDALDIFDRARKMHGALVAADEGLKYKSTYTALVHVAVNQLKRVPHPTDPAKTVNRAVMTDEEIHSLLVATTEEVKETTGVDLLVSAMNAIKNAINGRAATDKRVGREPITHADLPTIQQELNRIISEIPDGPAALQAYQDKLDEMAAKKEKAKANAEKREAEKAEKAKAKAAEARSKAAGETDEIDSDDVIIDDDDEAALQAELAGQSAE